jgi:hypothetical protein
MDPATAAIIAGLIKEFGPLLLDELRKAASSDARRVYSESEIQIAIDRAAKKLREKNNT